MKPYKTLLILLVFLVFLFGPSFFLDGPLKILPGLSVELPGSGDLNRYLDNFRSFRSSHPDGDSTIIDSPTSEPDSALFLPGNLIPAKRSSHLFTSDSGAALGLFIDSLRMSSRQTRIMYYGDSQLEGDRITDYLRKELRTITGGTGPGLLSPTMLVPYTRTAHLRSSSNWQRFNYLSYRNGEIDHKDLGPLFSISRFETDAGSSYKTGAWVRVVPSNSADSLAAIYNKLRLLYGNLTDTLIVNILENKLITHNDTLYPLAGINEYSAVLNNPGDIEIRFTGKSSPDIYGISIESEKGLVIDNIPSRGSVGYEFSLVGRDNLRELYSALSPDMIIMHYGLNVVLSNSDNYKFYEDGIYRQLVSLKEICPDALLIVAGVTDMAKGDETGIHSYQNIPLIRDAQKSAALRAGAMFWDSWQAMGGYDAIIDWRERDPSLASNDYTHISYAGGHQLADMLIDDLLSCASNNNEIINSDTLCVADVTETLQPVAGSVKELLSYDHSKPLIFTSPGFWLFFLLLLIIYSIIFKSPLLRNTYLFLISLFFYYKSGGVFFILLLVSTITDYLAGWLIYFSTRKSFKRLYLLFSLLVNLGMLGYFKYTAFITGVINDIAGTDFPVYDWFAMFSNRQFGTSFDISSIILPIGISFFTFQTISYTVDVYRGKTRPVRNILNFGFYVSFFPQLVAGPIVRASEFIPQLYQTFRLSMREWGHAVFLIVSGLIKKVVLSDYIAINFVDRVFNTPELFSGLENLFAVYGYGLQIYCDFSGYTDIAIGVALLLGFRLPLNFNSPYKAVNISDFWRRWHISLSRWLKDYLYIPLGGSRKGRLRTNLNLMITMLLGGLWHGAAWKFIIWGGLHGAGLVIHKGWQRIFPDKGVSSRFVRAVSVFVTFNFVTFCWIFFRAENTDVVRTMIERMTTSFSPGSYMLFLQAYAKVIIVIVSGYILHFLPVKIKESYRGLFIRLPLIVKMILIYIVAVALFNISSTDLYPFIYFRF